jgi:hypothetical protein
LAGWEDEWVETVKDIVHAEFDQAYAGMGVEDSGEDSICNINFFSSTNSFLCHAKMFWQLF